MIESSRRGFITGLIALGVAAPAIVRAASIMPVKAMPVEEDLAALLDSRLDSFDGKHDPRTYVRYSGYEAIEFDANRFEWKSPDQIAEETRIAVRADLYELKHHLKRKYEPDYEMMKARWARAHGG